MIPLIVISVFTAFVSFYVVRQTWVAFMLSVTTAFVLWVGLGSLAMHPLVDWREYFMIKSLSLSAAVTFIVFLVFKAGWRHQQREDEKSQRRDHEVE